jgi:hypothetical protein
VAKEFTLFALRPTHEASGVTNLLGESLLGIVHCDRARIYLSLKRLQWCWAHLKRDFLSVGRRRRRPSKAFGLKPAAPDARCSGTGPTIATARSAARPCNVGWRRSAARWSGCSHAASRAAIDPWWECAELHEHRDWLWAFIRQEGVEPTNNASEQALRHAVRAKALLRHAKRLRQPLRQNHAHGDRNLPPAKSLCVRLSRRIHPSPSRRANVAVIRHRGVNGYVLGEAAIVVANRLMDSLLVVYPGVGGVR